MTPLHKAFFAVGFGYAILCGLWDAITRRPNVHERYMAVMIGRQVRAALPAFRQLSEVVGKTAQAFHDFAQQMNRRPWTDRAISRLVRAMRSSAKGRRQRSW